MEEKLFERALAAVGGQKTDLAKRCGVSNQTVHNWVKAKKLSRLAVRLLEDVVEGVQA